MLNTLLLLVYCLSVVYQSRKCSHQSSHFHMTIPPTNHTDTFTCPHDTCVKSSHPQILPVSLPVVHTMLHTTHDFVQVVLRTLQGRHKSVSTDHSQTLHHPSGRPGQRFPGLKTCPVLPNFDSDHRPLPIRHALPTPASCPLHLCTLSTS